jgi:hypothetical protein
MEKSHVAKVGAFAALIIAVAFVLNCPGYLIERTSLVHRIADPMLLLIGLLGSVLRIRLLRIVGWLGIVWFIPVVMLAAPDLEHATPALEGFPTFWRLGTVALLSLALLLSFKLLALRRSDK